MPADQTETDRTDGTIRRVLILFVLLGFVSLLAAGIVTVQMITRTRYHAGWVEHTYRVELAVADVRRLVEQGETTRRGYMLAPDEGNFLKAYRGAAIALPVAVQRVAALSADNPRQRSNVAVLRGELGELVALRSQSVALVQSGRVGEAIAAFRGELNARRMRSIRATLDAMTAEEQQLLTVRNEEQRASIATFYTVMTVAGALLVFVALVTWLTVLRYTRDLAAAAGRLRALNDTLEDQVVERTADLTRANDEIQRFAYIVSHDLRSPLVNVMGFTAELEGATRTMAGLLDRAEATAPQIVDEDARLAVREDLPEAIGFIRTSTQKMDRLINAILKLSREGRRVITPEPLDIAAIVGGIRDSLIHRLEEDGATVSMERPLASVVSDRLAVEQILSNLIENAVKYRHPDRPVRIVVRGRARGGRVVYEVADNGRGIAPADHSRVFDLFRRSGTQDQPGEGIGLAHVRALAYRLGGIVDMTSELGQGTTFRLDLPQRFAEQEKSGQDRAI